MSPQITKPSNQVSTPAPNPARVRENQRRSRARRKEYLQELEAKIRKCETLGVQASMDIQIAARGVAEENTRLREDNRLLREENRRLKQTLDMGDVGRTTLRGIYSSIGDARMKVLHNDASEPTPAMGEFEAASEGSGLPIQRPAQASLEPPSSTVMQPLAKVQDISGSSRATGNSPSFPDNAIQPARMAQGLPESLNVELALGDDTSSCEYAAHIITSMRADISTDDVRAELGCGSDVQEWRKCKVDNSKLFVAVDRYTG
ncbi:hypothetical protein MMC28_006272 [Mycoblastus sanguinarius]|nr:hypothetical protein [Mycoblastus sanguinarius]